MSEQTYDEALQEYLDHNTSEFVDFSFLHYENAGELIAQYRYEPLYSFNKNASQWELIEENPDHDAYEYKDPSDFPGFYGQEGYRLRPLRISTSNYENFLGTKTSWPTGITTVASMRFTHTHNEDDYTVITGPDGGQLRGTFELYFGEFFLLGNNFKAIKRFNLQSELLQGDINSDNFLYLREDEYVYPDQTFLGEGTSFIEWQFGRAPIPESQRPAHLSMGTLRPSVQNPLHTESRRRWMAMRGSCLSWLRVYDDSNLGLELENKSSFPKSTICTVKAIIDYDKLREFLEDTFKHDEYMNGKESYDIIFYPPSMYMYPADSVVEVVEPVVNSVNTFTDKIIFKAPDSFKTDGNFHYRIEFYRTESEIVPFYSTSSFIGDESFEYGRWLKSNDNMDTWTVVGVTQPTYNNGFEEESGTDAIFTTHIKYVLTDELFELVRDSSSVLFKIHQLDGTMVHINN